MCRVGQARYLCEHYSAKFWFTYCKTADRNNVAGRCKEDPINKETAPCEVVDVRYKCSDCHGPGKNLPGSLSLEEQCAMWKNFSNTGTDTGVSASTIAKKARDEFESSIQRWIRDSGKHDRRDVPGNKDLKDLSKEEWETYGNAGYNSKAGTQLGALYRQDTEPWGYNARPEHWVAPKSKDPRNLDVSPAPSNWDPVSPPAPSPEAGTSVESLATHSHSKQFSGQAGESATSAVNPIGGFATGYQLGLQLGAEGYDTPFNPRTQHLQSTRPFGPLIQQRSNAPDPSSPQQKGRRGDGGRQQYQRPSVQSSQQSDSNNDDLYDSPTGPPQVPLQGRIVPGTIQMADSQHGFSQSNSHPTNSRRGDDLRPRLDLRPASAAFPSSISDQNIINTPSSNSEMVDRTRHISAASAASGQTRRESSSNLGAAYASGNRSARSQDSPESQQPRHLYDLTTTSNFPGPIETRGPYIESRIPPGRPLPTDPPSDPRWRNVGGYPGQGHSGDIRRSRASRQRTSKKTAQENPLQSNTESSQSPETSSQKANQSLPIAERPKVSTPPNQPDSTPQGIVRRATTQVSEANTPSLRLQGGIERRGTMPNVNSSPLTAAGLEKSKNNAGGKAGQNVSNTQSSVPPRSALPAVSTASSQGTKSEVPKPESAKLSKDGNSTVVQGKSATHGKSVPGKLESGKPAQGTPIKGTPAQDKRVEGKPPQAPTTQTPAAPQAATQGKDKAAKTLPTNTGAAKQKKTIDTNATVTPGTAKKLTGLGSATTKKATGTGGTPAPKSTTAETKSAGKTGTPPVKTGASAPRSSTPAPRPSAPAPRPSTPAPRASTPAPRASTPVSSSLGAKPPPATGSAKKNQIPGTSGGSSSTAAKDKGKGKKK